MHENLHKMKLSTSAVVAVVMILLSPTVVILFPLVSEQQQQQQQQQQESKPGSILKLAKGNVSIDIPIAKGYIDGNVAYFIATDASDKHAVSSITNNTGFPVNYAPLLNNTPDSIRGQGYVFLNGVQGEAPGGFQLPVANAVPGDKDYSPLWQTNFVKWNDNATARELKSVEEIMTAQNSGELIITETNIVVNSPAIKWQNSSQQAN